MQYWYISVHNTILFITCLNFLESLLYNTGRLSFFVLETGLRSTPTYTLDNLLNP